MKIATGRTRESMRSPAERGARALYVYSCVVLWMNHCISDTMALRDRTVLINSPVPHIHASVMSLDRTCMISDYCTFTFFGIHMLVRAARCIDTRGRKATAEGRGAKGMAKVRGWVLTGRYTCLGVVIAHDKQCHSLLTVTRVLQCHSHFPARPRT